MSVGLPIRFGISTPSQKSFRSHSRPKPCEDFHGAVLGISICEVVKTTLKLTMPCSIMTPPVQSTAGRRTKHTGHDDHENPGLLRHIRLLSEGLFVNGMAAIY
jgi:hypothetical protein